MQIKSEFYSLKIKKASRKIVQSCVTKIFKKVLAKTLYKARRKGMEEEVRNLEIGEAWQLYTHAEVSI